MNSGITTIGILGCGNVGAGVARMLLEDCDFISQKLGRPLKLLKIAVRDKCAPRLFDLPKDLITTDPYEIVAKPEIKVVVELIGGIEPAKSFILKAISSGQHVVTANKALLALHGQEIFEAASANKVEVMFEAAVAGGIPIIRCLKEGLPANRIKRLYGILNGTTNYILTRMSREGLDFSVALKAAQDSGYAEADPTFDIEGFDAAHKLIILTALAFGVLPKLDDIYVEGISRISQADIRFAQEFAYVVKLLAIAVRNEEDGRLEVRLHPAMLPTGSLLAEVGDALNAVMISGHAAGDIVLNGPGAGTMPTASSVLADIAELARNEMTESFQRVPPLGWCSLSNEKLKDMSDILSSYYLRFTVADRPGVLAAITSIFAKKNISIAQVVQKKAEKGKQAVPVVILTHAAREADMISALKETDALECTLAPAMLIRVLNSL